MMANSQVGSFVSYAREDVEFALRLTKDLKAAGAIVWLDSIDIAPGERWDRAVEEALRVASQLLVIISPASVESENVMDEIAFALEERKTVIPVLHRDCVIPFRLRRLQYIDFRTEYESNLEELVKSLHVDQATSYRKPTLFIASAFDQGLAYAAAEELRDCVRGITWDRMANSSSLSGSLLEALMDMLDEANCGLFLFGQKGAPAPVEAATFGDGLIFELGLMVGRFGRERSFLILPTDVPEALPPRVARGLVSAHYNMPADRHELPAAIRAPCDQVRQALRKLNPQPLGDRIEDETYAEPLPALSEAQKRHLSNLARGGAATARYEGRGSLRSELRQLVGIGLLEKLPGRHIGDLETGTVHNLSDIVKLTDAGRRWVERKGTAAVTG